MASEAAGAREAVLLVGHGSRDAEGVAQYRAFASELMSRTGERVEPAFLEFDDPPIVEGVRRCIAAGAERITVLPLFLGAATHQKNDVPTAINWLRARYPAVSFAYGAPLGAHAAIAGALGERALAVLAAADEPAGADTAVLLVGRGSRDPDSNGDLYKVGRLLFESRRFGLVEACFIAIAEPDLPAGIERCVRLGARTVVAVPHMLFTGVLTKRMERLIAERAALYPGVKLLASAPLGAAPGVLSVVEQRIAEARAGTAAANCDSCKYRVLLPGFERELGLPQGSDHNHGLRGTGLDGVHVHADGSIHAHG